MLVTLTLMGVFVAACSPTSSSKEPKSISVQVEVDFGPVDKPGFTKTLELPAGSTVLDATIACDKTEQGFVCCDKENVQSIAGVECDPDQEAWWLYDINGEKGPASPHRLKLYDGDKIRWNYVVRGSLEERPVTIYQSRASPREAQGGIRGLVKYSGNVPELPPYTIHKNSNVCGSGQTMHPCARPVGKSDFSDAVVWIEEMTTGKPWSSQPAKQMLDQAGCIFDPHLIVARVDSQLEIKNSDPVRHTVHAYSLQHRTVFDFAMPRAGTVHVVTLDTPGVFNLQCDAGHRWMRAHLIVVQNPYVAVTDQQGAYVIDDIPPGSYTINVWHDWFGLQKQTVQVKGGSVVLLETTFKAGTFSLDLRYAQAR